MLGPCFSITQTILSVCLTICSLSLSLSPPPLFHTLFNSRLDPSAAVIKCGTSDPGMQYVALYLFMYGSLLADYVSHSET